MDSPRYANVQLDAMGDVPTKVEAIKGSENVTCKLLNYPF